VSSYDEAVRDAFGVADFGAAFVSGDGGWTVIAPGIGVTTGHELTMATDLASAISEAETYLEGLGKARISLWLQDDPNPSARSLWVSTY
jgi:hypothetical protein